MTPTKANPANAPIVAAGIGRVSLLIQKDNYSLAAQTSRINALAENNGITIAPEHMFDDGGYSGTSFDRPAFRRVLRLVREGKVNAVVFPYVDRFARNMEGGLNMIRQFREAGARVLLGEIGWVTDEAHCKMMLAMFLAMAETQRDSIVEKSRGGVAIKIKSGLVHGSRSPYGFEFMSRRKLDAERAAKGLPIDPGKPQNTYRPIDAELKNVLFMADLAVNHGMSGRAICRELVARGIKTKRGGKWHPSTVRGILCDALYSTGTWSYGKNEAVEPLKRRNTSPDRHRARTSVRVRPQDEWVGSVQLAGLPIMSAEYQERVAAALELNGRTSQGRPKVSHDGREAILKSLCKCATCGKAIAPIHRTRPDGKRDIWYRCTHRDAVSGLRHCAERSIRAEILEDAVWNHICEIFAKRLDAMIREHHDAITARSGGAPDESLADLMKQETRLTAKRAEAKAAVIEADAAEDKAMFKRMAADFEARLALVRRRIAASRDEAELPAVADDVRQRLRKAFSPKMTDPTARRALLVEAVDGIRYASGGGVVTVRVPLAVCVNRQRQERDIDSYLALTSRFKVAA